MSKPRDPSSKDYERHPLRFDSPDDAHPRKAAYASDGVSGPDHRGARHWIYGNSVPVMHPTLPPADRLLPYLQRIDAARIYSNFGPLVMVLKADSQPIWGAVNASPWRVAALRL